MKKLLFFVVIAFFFNRVSAQTNFPAGFTVVDIHFDESVDKNKPLPKIPASWHFVGVSNYRGNGSNLWFQDKDGNIFLISGFTDDFGEFVANETIRKFNSMPAAQPVSNICAQINAVSTNSLPAGDKLQK
jgi:hypothetical protein